MAEFFGKAAGIFSILGYLLYIKAIVWNKTTHPSKTTWWIWTPLTLILYFSAKDSGGQETLWVARSEVAGIITIALLSIRFGSKEREEGENLCIIGSIVSLVTLWVLRLSEVALVLALITDSLALWSTIQKSARNPEEEDLVAWIFTQTGNALNICAISKWAFGEIVYPVWLFILDGTIVYLLLDHFFKKRKEKKI